MDTVYDVTCRVASQKVSPSPISPTNVAMLIIRSPAKLTKTSFDDDLPIAVVSVLNVRV
jgi:hypothetical protein